MWRLGQVYADNADMTNPRCVAKVADCPAGQALKRMVMAICRAMILKSLVVMVATQLRGMQGALACHMAGRAYMAVVDEGGVIDRVACVALSGCPNGQGVEVSDDTGSQCITANEISCRAAGFGYDVNGEVCDAQENFVPIQASDCSGQGRILNRRGAGDEDNRCVDSVTDCNDMHTLNMTKDTCVAATGVCVAPMGYDATTKECVEKPTRATQCASLGRILGTSASTTANVDGCVANAAACAAEYAAIGDVCVGKAECVRLGQGYNSTFKECETPTDEASCLAASTESVLNMAGGDKCLTSRFDCGDNHAVIGDTTDGFACVAKAGCFGTPIRRATTLPRVHVLLPQRQSTARTLSRLRCLT